MFFLFPSEISELNLKTLIIKEIRAKIQRIYVNGIYLKVTMYLTQTQY